jgi:signal transduction histidine kinase
MLSSPRSLGLIGIRERVIACGGELVIQGVRGRGTTLALRIPLRPTGGAAT